MLKLGKEVTRGPCGDGRRHSVHTAKNRNAGRDTGLTVPTSHSLNLDPGYAPIRSIRGLLKLKLFLADLSVQSKYRHSSGRLRLGCTVIEASMCSESGGRRSL